MNKQVLDFFENSVCDFNMSTELRSSAIYPDATDSLRSSSASFNFGKLDIHHVASKFESVVVLLGGLYIEPEYRKWIADCIVHIRDFRSGGYGIRELAYVLLAVWYCYYPDDADTVMLRFVVGGAGCWSDIKRFLGVWRKLGYHTDSRNGGAVEGRIVSIMVDRLWSYYGMGRSEVAGLAKWVPREKSPRYGWLYDQFVLAWGSKAGWRGERMDTWRRRFRKILASMGGDAAPSARHMEPKDLVSIAIRGGGGKVVENLDQKWCEILDRFSQYCDIPLDTIPVVTPFRYNENQNDLYEKIAYAILIAQRGIIGRIMFNSGYWVVANSYDHFSDIISRIRGILGYGMVWGKKFMDMIHEASEVSGYENPRVLVI